VTCSSHRAPFYTMIVNCSPPTFGPHTREVQPELSVREEANAAKSGGLKTAAAPLAAGRCRLPN
jgi:hypothetical protein